MYPPVILANNALLMTTDDKCSINSVPDEIMAAEKTSLSHFYSLMPVGTKVLSLKLLLAQKMIMTLQL